MSMGTAIRVTRFGAISPSVKKIIHTYITKDLKL
jgi:hypothetical protein